MTEEVIKPQTLKAITFLKGWPTFPVLTAIFVDPVTGEKGKIETQAFPPGPDGQVPWRAVFQWVDARNGKANLYFLVNPLRDAKNNKAAKTDIAALAALHVDVDVRVGEDQAIGIKRIIDTFGAYKVKPSLITSSGGGAQAFWLLDPPLPLDGTKEAVADAESFNKQIERDLDGDHCFNVDRIMRLPGTVNIPNSVKLKKGRKPALAYVIDFDPARKYPLASFTKADPDDKPKGAAGQPTAAAAQGGSKEKKKHGPKPAGDTFYENVPVVPDDVPILTIDDDRLKFMDPMVKYIVLHGVPPEEAPDEVKQMTRGTLDMKCVADAVRIGLSDKATKQVYKLGKISADAAQWPRGFEADMDRLIEKARELKRDPDVERYSALYMVLLVGGKVKIAKWKESDIFAGQRELEFMSVDDWRFFNRRDKKITWVKERDEHGNETGNLKKKTQSMTEYWLNHPQCRQYEGIRFVPSTNASAVGPNMNLWRGWIVPPKPGDWSLMKAHMKDNLCAGNEEHFNYLIRWMAFIVQFRTRTEVIVILRSDEEGTGKSFFTQQFGHIFGSAYMEVSNAEHVVGKFNYHLSHVLLINPDEALFSGDHRHRNALWNLTTSDTITVEPKGLGVYTAKNHLNFVITTNTKKAVEVGSTARRVFSLDVSTNHINDWKYFEAIADQLKAGGYEAMLHELQNMDLSDFNVKNCPKTASLREQIALSRNGVDSLVEQVCSEARVPFPHYKKPGYTITTTNDTYKGFDNFIDHHADRELSRLRAFSVKRLLCKEWGCMSGDDAQVRVNAAEVKTYGTDRLAGLQWPPLKELQARFEKKHGPQEWLVADAVDWITADSNTHAFADSEKTDAEKLDQLKMV